MMSHSEIQKRTLVFVLFAYSILGARTGVAQSPPQTYSGIPAQSAKHTAILPDAPLRAVARERSHSGSSMRTLGDLQIETFLDASGIQISLSDASGRKIDSTQTRGVATLKVEGEAKRFRFDLLPDQTGSLKSKTNLARTTGRQVEIEIFVVGLEARFAAPGTIRFREVITVPPSTAQLATAAVTRQGVCPVSGKRLGSMGTPIPVSVGRKTVYLCCQACESIVAKNPTKYETGKPTILISTSTAEDAKAIAQQKVCPVMDEPLGGMGTPIKVVIGERPLFLCCKGCIKKIEAEPMKYLAMVDKTRGSAKNVQSPASRLATPESSSTYKQERQKR